MSLSPEELARHKRHIMLREIGGPGVQKLRAARVSIVGAGALGAPLPKLSNMSRRPAGSNINTRSSRVTQLVE